MKIKQLKINSFIGVDELNYNPSNLNIFEGPKGAGKSSILEAIEMTIAHNKRRTEVVNHSESEEATLFIEMDNGLEVERRVRREKNDYLKIKKQGEGVKSTEAELRKFLSGDIFRPLDFIDMKIEEQTEIILSMIQMNYSGEEIIEWFGGKDVLSNINTSKHLLQVLKDIEVREYKARQENNREIKTLESQVRGIEQELPPNYDGEEWKEKSIQEYYKKVSDAEKINNFILQGKQLQENIQTKIDSINSELESKKAKSDLKYRDYESDIKDIIDLSKNKIEKAEAVIKDTDAKQNVERLKLEAEEQKEIETIKEKYRNLITEKVKEIEVEADEQKDLIQIQEQKISGKETELIGLDEKKQLEIEGFEKETLQKIETEKVRVGKAVAYLKEHIEIDIEPLQKEAEKVEHMKEHLREWDRMLDIRDGKLAKLKAYTAELSEIIEVARNKPSELLKQHKLPINGIGIDEKGLIRINGTLLDGLSDGEKLEAAFKIALQRIGELRIMCLDGFEKLNESEQKKIIKLCEDEDIQAFITITADTEDGEIEIKNKLN